MIIEIFSPKNSTKKLAFLTPHKAKLCKILIHNIGFEKNANCFAEIWQKSQKIVIITPTPGATKAKALCPLLLKKIVSIIFWMNVYVSALQRKKFVQEHFRPKGRFIKFVPGSRRPCSRRTPCAGP
jgi:hypothetical protein